MGEHAAPADYVNLSPFSARVTRFEIPFFEDVRLVLEEVSAYGSPSRWKLARLVSDIEYWQWGRPFGEEGFRFIVSDPPPQGPQASYTWTYEEAVAQIPAALAELVRIAGSGP